MAYKTEIQIGVKGVRELTQLQKQLDGTSYKIDQINKNQVKAFGGVAQSLDNYVKRLNQAEAALKKVSAGTAQEARAINNYVTALGAANGAKERQNRLINEEIARRSKATAELKRYNAEATKPLSRGSMADRFLNPQRIVGETQYEGPIGPGPASSILGGQSSPVEGRIRRIKQAQDALVDATRQMQAVEQRMTQQEIANDQKVFNAKLEDLKRLHAEELKQIKNRDRAELESFDKRLKAAVERKKTKTGTAGFLEQAGAFGLGTGFPLLFGGGAGQVIGGGIGTALAKSFGLAGEAAMGLQIALSAILGKVEELVTRFTEVGNAVRSIDMDALANTFITVTENARTLTRQLVEAGNAQAAVGVAARETAIQTGVLPEATTDITNNVNLLSNTWDEVVGSVSGLVSIIATPLVSVLTAVLQLVAKLAQGLNVILSSAGLIVKKVVELIFKIPGLQPILKAIENVTKAIVEEEEKSLAKLVETGETLEREYRQNLKLYEIEKGRTAGRTVAEQLVNAEIDKRINLQKLEDATNAQILAKRKEFANQTSHAAQVELAYQEIIIGKNAEIERSKIEQNYQLEVQKLHEKELEELAKKRSEKYKEMAEDVKLQTQLLTDQAESLNYQATITDNIASLTNARRQTESDLLNLQISRLERQKDEAKHFLDKIKLNNLIIDKRKEQAKLEYDSQLTSIKLSVSKAQQERVQIKLKEQQIKLQLEQVRLEAEAIEDVDRRNAALNRINQREKSTLQVVEDMNRAADHSLETTRKIASFQQKSARYAYQGKIEALETSRAQERMSIFLNSQKGSMSTLAAKSGTYASNMERAASAASKQKTAFEKGTLGATETKTVGTSIPIDEDIRQKVQGGGGFKSVEAMVSALEEAQKERNRINTIRAARGQDPLGPQRYAQGGYTTKPHIGMVGEAGPEYIVPERKAAAFATNYLMGARGASAIPRYAEGGYVGPVNIQTGPVMQQDNEKYVTLNQFEAGMRSLMNSMVNNRSYGARRYQGVS